MATIKSAVPDSTATLKLLKPPSGVVTTATITGRGVTVAIDVHTADLHAALGIDELGCGCDEADSNLNAAIARAEKAEAERDEAQELARQRHEANSAIIAQLNEAEATIARIKARVDASTSGWLKRELQACIDPKPAFVLPGVAGAIVLAKGSGNRQDYELHRTTKGRWFTPGLRQQWTDAEMLKEFSAHRLINPQP